jgi:hypothetical protein
MQPVSRTSVSVSRPLLQHLARALEWLEEQDLRAIERMLRTRRRALAAPRRKEIARQGGLARKRALTPTQRRTSAQRAGRARWKTLSPERRRQIARRAVRARWAKVKKTKRK